MMSARTPSIGIVIPTYNCGRYLRETLDSVLAQTPRPIDVTVVDDGSTDNTSAVVQSFGDAVRYVSQENSGVCRARNRGLSLTQGEWVMFLDADDYLERDALALLLEQTGRAEVGVVYGDKYTMEDDGTRIAAVANRECSGPVPAAARASFNGAAFEPGAAIVRRALADALGGFDQRYSPSEDRHFWIRCGALAEFVHVGRPVMHYRIRPGSHSKNRARQVPASIRVRIDLLQWLRERGIRLFDDEPDPAALLSADLNAVYWRREWNVVDAVLALASDYSLTDPVIERVRRMRKWPVWMIGLKDGLDRLRR